MHYLLNGYGFQTWEYSPAYAVRSYAYLWLYAWPLKLHSELFPVNKVMSMCNRVLDGWLFTCCFVDHSTEAVCHNN